MRFFRLLGLSVQFMTQVPIPKQLKVTDKDFGAMTMFFPASALLVGAILAAVYLAFAWLRLPWAGAAAAMLAAWLATGGLHIDGLADMADAFGAGKTKERTLLILKDSRVGTFGVLAIVFDIILKIILIGSIQNFNILLILLALPAAGKIPLAVCAAAGRYPREEGTGKSMIENAGAKESIVCAALCQVILFFCMGISSFILLPILIAAGFVLKAAATRRIGGVTGDILGAANETGELLFLLFAAIIGAAA